MLYSTRLSDHFISVLSQAGADQVKGYKLDWTWKWSQQKVPNTSTDNNDLKWDADAGREECMWCNVELGMLDQLYACDVI